MIKELLALWKEYNDLSEYNLDAEYMSYDPNAYDGDGSYYKSAEGFFNWLEDKFEGRA